MGLFNGYLKEGPGIDKNAKKKRGIFLYIDILFRKFFKLIKANCLYILFSIPFMAVVFLFTAPHIMSCIGITYDSLYELAQSAVKSGAETVNEAQEILRIAGTYQLILTTFFTIMIFNFFGAGPVSAAYAYATRCFTRGEHTWLMSDGKDQFKENFKNSILMFIVNILLLYVLFTAFYFYGNISGEGSIGYLAIFARPFTLMLVFVLAMVNMFAYQIMVTYECKFRDLIKNSLMISIAKLPMCVLLAGIAISIIALIAYNIPDAIVSLLVYMLIGLMFTRFSIEFYAARVLEKNMRALKKRESKNKAKITYLDSEENGEEQE